MVFRGTPDQRFAADETRVLAFVFGAAVLIAEALD
jgi:hypothetical protein